MSNSTQKKDRDLHHRFFTRKIRHAIEEYCKKHGIPVPDRLKLKTKIDVDRHTRFHNKFYRECFAARAQKYSPHHQIKNCARCDFRDICFCRIPADPEDQEVIELMRAIMDGQATTKITGHALEAPALIWDFIEYAIAPHL